MAECFDLESSELTHFWNLRAYVMCVHLLLGFYIHFLIASLERRLS